MNDRLVSLALSYARMQQAAETLRASLSSLAETVVPRVDVEVMLVQLDRYRGLLWEEIRKAGGGVRS